MADDYNRCLRYENIKVHFLHTRNINEIERYKTQKVHEYMTNWYKLFISIQFWLDNFQILFFELSNFSCRLRFIACSTTHLLASMSWKHPWLTVSYDITMNTSKFWTNSKERMARVLEVVCLDSAVSLSRKPYWRIWRSWKKRFWKTTNCKKKFKMQNLKFNFIKL